MVLVGGFRVSADVNPLIGQFAHDKAFFLIVALVPLLLLSSALELFAEVGPLVALLVIALLALAAARSQRMAPRVLGLLASYAFLGAQVSGDLYNSRYVYFFLLAGPLAGVALYSRKSTRVLQEVR